MSRRYSLAEELRRASIVVSGDDFAELALLANRADQEEGRSHSRYGSVTSGKTDGSCGDGKLLLKVANDEEKDRRFSLLGETELLQDELKSMITLAIPIISTYLLELIPGYRYHYTGWARRTRQRFAYAALPRCSCACQHVG